MIFAIEYEKRLYSHQHYQRHCHEPMYVRKLKCLKRRQREKDTGGDETTRTSAELATTLLSMIDEYTRAVRAKGYHLRMGR